MLARDDRHKSIAHLLIHFRKNYRQFTFSQAYAQFGSSTYRLIDGWLYQGCIIKVKDARPTIYEFIDIPVASDLEEIKHRPRPKSHLKIVPVTKKEQQKKEKTVSQHQLRQQKQQQSKEQRLAEQQAARQRLSNSLDYFENQGLPFTKTQLVQHAETKEWILESDLDLFNRYTNLSKRLFHLGKYNAVKEALERLTATGEIFTIKDWIKESRTSDDCIAKFPELKQQYYDLVQSRRWHITGERIREAKAKKRDKRMEENNQKLLEQLEIFKANQVPKTYQELARLAGVNRYVARHQYFSPIRKEVEKLNKKFTNEDRTKRLLEAIEGITEYTPVKDICTIAGISPDTYRRMPNCRRILTALQAKNKQFIQSKGVAK